MSCERCVYTVCRLLEVINDNESLVTFLIEHGVIRRSVICPLCEIPCTLSTDSWKYTCRRWRYVEKPKVKRQRIQCLYKLSARTGTFFEKSKLSIIKICKFVVFWIYTGHPRQIKLQIELEMSSNTVVDWSNFCREVCMVLLTENRVPLGGVGKEVEIDEAKLGKRKYNRGRVIEDQWVFGMYERDSKNCFFVPVENRTKETLLAIIKEWVLPGTKILSYCWKAYDCLSDEGFIHQIVNHSQNFVDPDTGAHTQNIERSWRNIRGNIPKYGRREYHFDGYLMEHLFKFKYPNYNEQYHNFFKAISKMYSPEPDNVDHVEPE